MKKSEIIQLLESRNIQASYHRMKILEYLVNHRTHPTVDKIYSSISGEIPTLSRTTVYNTLKVLVEKKLVAQVTVEENELRYDYSEGPHMHFKCTKCGELYDIFDNCKILEVKNIDGHSIDEHHVYLKGICRNCREKNA